MPKGNIWSSVPLPHCCEWFHVRAAVPKKDKKRGEGRLLGGKRPWVRQILRLIEACLQTHWKTLFHFKCQWGTPSIPTQLGCLSDRISNYRVSFFPSTVLDALSARQWVIRVCFFCVYIVMFFLMGILASFILWKSRLVDSKSKSAAAVGFQRMVAAVAFLFCFCLLPTIVLYYDFITVEGQVSEIEKPV